MSRIAQTSHPVQDASRRKSDSSTNVEVECPSSDNESTESRPVTRRVLREQFAKWTELQGRGIRWEFRKERQETYTQFAQLRKEIQVQFAQHGEETSMQFAQHREETNVHFAQHRKEMRITRAMQSNQTAFRLRDRIQLVRHPNQIPGVFCEPPQCAPRWVGQFWALKEPKNWNKLVRLLEFYETDSWDRWGLGYDSEDEDGSVDIIPRHGSLEDAVRNAPDEALSNLAPHLGLNYTMISIYVPEDLRSKEVRQVATHLAKRREQGSESDDQEKKRPRSLGRRTTSLLTSYPDRTDSSPAVQFTAAGTEPTGHRLSLKDLIGESDDGKKPPPETCSDYTRLGWKSPSDKTSFDERQPSSESYSGYHKSTSKSPSEQASFEKLSNSSTELATPSGERRSTMSTLENRDV